MPLKLPRVLLSQIGWLTLVYFLWAICFESVMKSDRAFRCMSTEGQSEEDLLRHSLNHEAGYIPEPELPVILRMSYDTAALSIQLLQAGQPFLYQGFANALPLKLRRHRDRP